MTQGFALTDDRFTSRPRFGVEQAKALFTIFVIPIGLSVWFLFLCEWLGFPLPKGTDKRMVWVVLAIFLPIWIAVARNLIDRRDRIVADASGIMWRPWSDQVIPWTAIRRVTHKPLINSDFIGLWLDDPARYPSRGFRSWLSWRSKYGDIPIHAQSTGATPAQLLEVIEHFRPGVIDRSA